MSQAYFISGIDTDAGKSYVTGYLASLIMKEGMAACGFHGTGDADTEVRVTVCSMLHL